MGWNIQNRCSCGNLRYAKHTLVSTHQRSVWCFKHYNNMHWKDMATNRKLTGVPFRTPHHVIGMTGEWTDGAEANGLANMGETLLRMYTVMNEGTTTLSGICITDAKFGDYCLGCVIPTGDQLRPGEAFTCDVPSKVSSSARWSYSRMCLLYLYDPPVRGHTAQWDDSCRISAAVSHAGEH